MTQVFHVAIKEHQDWFFATCEELPGLFVGHREYEVVRRNIPEAITMLLEHDSQDEVIVMEAPATAPRLMGQKVYTASKAA